MGNGNARKGKLLNATPAQKLGLREKADIHTVIVTPMTAAGEGYPTRISCTFKKKKGQFVLDQIRKIDKSRLIKKLDTIDPNTQVDVISVLQRLFSF